MIENALRLCSGHRSRWFYYNIEQRRADCGLPGVAFSQRGRNGKWHLQRLFLSETVALRVSCLFAVTPLPVKMRLERSAELVGAKPLHLLTQTALPLKSPTGAFIATLRSANAVAPNAKLK